MLALCWHSTPVYYAFYYAGIFDAGLDTEFHCTENYNSFNYEYFKTSSYNSKYCTLHHDCMQKILLRILQPVATVNVNCNKVTTSIHYNALINPKVGVDQCLVPIPHLLCLHI